MTILYQQSQGRKAPQGNRFEANFNLHPNGNNEVSGLQDIPLGPSNAVTLPQSKDPVGTEEMMVEFTSTDMYGDFE